MDEGFCCPARQKIAGILDVLQDFLTWQGGKRPGQTAFHACEYRIYKNNLKAVSTMVTNTSYNKNRLSGKAIPLKTALK